MTTRFRLQELLDARNKGAKPEDRISQRELARLTGVSPTTINAMYNNTTVQVSLATLDAISAALGIEPGELVEREPKKPRGKGK